MSVNSKETNLKKRIGLPLILWGIINMTAGILFFFTVGFIQGVLLQAFFWGLIDAILGLITYLRKKEFDLKKIKKILLINTYLDVVYMIVGLILLLLFINPFLAGNGLGVVIQGLFLFFADLIHYRHLKNTSV
ncbi:MAG: conserved membrane protein of unknown function [Promethearchaeota archaeon]|nr:MAG: conserved membrane protein of unknown function [Candidatus Lokiarchaeota archaeon]